MSNVANGWQKIRLKEVIKKAYRPVDVRSDELYRQIGIRSHGKGIFHKEAVTGDEIGDKRIFWVEPGDFTLNIVFAWEGAVALISEAEKGMCASHRFPMFVADKEMCDIRFILRYFQTPRGVWDLGIASPGGAGRNKTLNQGDFLDLPLLLPPLTEQQRIADIIDKWDEAITLADALVAALRERKRGIMQCLLMGEVRDKWDAALLGEVAEVILSGVDKKSYDDQHTVRLCNYTDVFYNTYINNAIPFMVSTASDNEIEKCRLRLHDVIITKDSETADEIAQASVVIEELENVICGYHLAIVRPNQEKVFGPFLREILMIPDVHHQFEKFANGVTRFGLTSSTINTVTIPFPSLLEQREIAEVLRLCDNWAEGFKTYAERLREQKKGLMQKLLTGEVQVRVEN